MNKIRNKLCVLGLLTQVEIILQWKKKVLNGEDLAEGLQILLRSLEKGSFGRVTQATAGPSVGINTHNNTVFCSYLKPFTTGSRAQSLLLGLKSTFIFSLTYQPVCSSEDEDVPILSGIHAR